MARRLLLRERAEVGWQPTDLLQEAYVRLLDWRIVRWQNRAHFFATTARMMRRVLVDAARARHAAKRNPDGRVVSLDDVDVEAPGGGVDLVALKRPSNRSPAWTRDRARWSSCDSSAGSASRKPPRRWACRRAQ